MNKNPIVTVKVWPIGLKSKEGEPFTNVGQIQERDPDRVARYGGRPFMAWVRQAVGGKLFGTPLASESFYTLKGATLFAEVAAQFPDDSSRLECIRKDSPPVTVVESLPTPEQVGTFTSVEQKDIPAEAPPSKVVGNLTKRGRGRPRSYCVTCKKPVIKGTDFCQDHQLKGA